MKRLRYAHLIFVLLLIGLSVSRVSAAAISVTAMVDSTTASLEDYILLTVSVDGTRTEPTLAGLGDFRVSSRGSSSQMRFVNGKMSSSKEFTYLLQPLKPGTFVIGPFRVVHKKKTYASDTITLIITEHSAAAPETDTRTEREVFITSEVDNSSPYVHEQIIYTFKFYRRVEISEARLSVVPDFEGFLSESLGKEREYRQVINGQTYVVTELRKALFPVKSGVLTIAASTLDCELIIRERRGRGGRLNDPFFDNSFFSFNARRKRKTLRTSPLTVMVHQLPMTGQPDGFGQLVGEFSLSGKLSTTSVSAGDSATLTLRLHGDGNMRGMKTIDLPRLQNVKVYDDKPVFKADQSSKRAGGTMIFKKALVPMEQGELAVPPVEVSYFNPTEKKYKTTRAGPFAITVLASRDSEALQSVVPGRVAVPKEDVMVLAEDILPIHTGLDVLEYKREPHLTAVHFVLLVVPVCLYVLFVFAYTVRAHRYSDSERVRARSAWPRFSKQIPVLRASINGGNDDFCSEAARALRDFIGDRLGITGSAFTPPEIAQFLIEAGVHEQLVARIKQVLEQCDVGCYGVAVSDASARQELLKELIQTARELHRSR